MREAAPDPPLLGAAVRRRLSGGGEEKTKEMKGEGVRLVLERRKEKKAGWWRVAAVAVGSLGGGEHTRTEGGRE